MVALIILIVIILGIFLFKMFLDKYGKFIPSSLLIMFIKQVRDIENGGDGKIVIKTIGNYEVIVLIDEGKAVEAISVDMKNNKIYSGVVKNDKPSFGDLLVPIKTPFGTVDERLSELEDKLVDEVIEIIVKYKK